MVKKEKEFSEYVTINWVKLLPMLIGLIIGGVAILVWIYLVKG